MIVITAYDNYNNKIYIIKETNQWRFYDGKMNSYSLSNFTSNATELYIALNTMGEFDDVIYILKKFAEYLKPETIKYHIKGE